METEHESLRHIQRMPWPVGLKLQLEDASVKTETQFLFLGYRLFFTQITVNLIEHTLQLYGHNQLRWSSILHLMFGGKTVYQWTNLCIPKDSSQKPNNHNLYINQSIGERGRKNENPPATPSSHRQSKKRKKNRQCGWDLVNRLMVSKMNAKTSWSAQKWSAKKNKNNEYREIT